MPTRLIVDGTFTDTILFYQTFPTEPTVRPNSTLDILLPIDAADRIASITLLALLRRMNAIPAAEQQLLIITHGNETGLAVRLVAGTDFKASDEVVHMLRVLGGAKTRVTQINALPEADQAAAWQTMLQGLRYIDGTAMVPTLPIQSVETYRDMFNYLLNRTAGLNSALPASVQAAGVQAWAPTPLDGVGRTNLDALLDVGNQVRARNWARLDFRGGNTGRSRRAMAALRSFFGAQLITTPNVVAFDGPMPVTINASFDANAAANIDQTTHDGIFQPNGRVRSGRQPVRLDEHDAQVAVAEADIPAARRFDTVLTRAGDEVFVRFWLTSVHPHRFAGWLRAVSTTSVEAFARTKLSADISHWAAPRTTLPFVGLWLVDDHNALMTQPTPIQMPPANGDPLGGIDVPPPPPPTTFALPLDTEYRQHLVADPPPATP